MISDHVSNHRISGVMRRGDSHPDSSCSNPIIVLAPNYVLSSSHRVIHLPADNIILITG